MLQHKASLLRGGGRAQLFSTQRQGRVQLRPRCLLVHPLLRPTCFTVAHRKFCLRPAQATSENGGGGFQPVDAVKKELALQSTRLPTELRERVERAVEALGNRVTVGDISARAGVKLAEAEQALQALTFDSLGALEVSNDGDVVYALPKDFRDRIRNKSLLLQAKPALTAVQSGAWYLLRIAFGSALVASVVLATLAILVVLSSNNRDDRNDRRGGGGGGMRMFLNLSDLFFYFDPFYYRDVRQRVDSGEEMSFPEAVFSLVFGDGDPNMNFEERRWKLLGRYIQSKGGVVTAEEIAPFLDPPGSIADTSSGSSDTLFVDESYVLPALLRFGGETVVDESGTLLYRFPTLQTTGVKRMPQAPAERMVEEEPWTLTEAPASKAALAVALGAANVIAVLALTSMLGDPHAKVALLRNGLGFVVGLMPALQLYAASFFTIPLVRWVVNQSRNTAIEIRNAAREMAARRLAAPSKQLAKKLAAARNEGTRKLVSDKDVIYSSGKDVDEQLSGSELQDFDQRLQRSVTRKAREPRA